MQFTEFHSKKCSVANLVWTLSFDVVESIKMESDQTIGTYISIFARQLHFSPHLLVLASALLVPVLSVHFQFFNEMHSIIVHLENRAHQQLTANSMHRFASGAPKTANFRDTCSRQDHSGPSVLHSAARCSILHRCSPLSFFPEGTMPFGAFLCPLPLLAIPL